MGCGTSTLPVGPRGEKGEEGEWVAAESPRASGKASISPAASLASGESSLGTKASQVAAEPRCEELAEARSGGQVNVDLFEAKASGDEEQKVPVLLGRYFGAQGVHPFCKSDKVHTTPRPAYDAAMTKRLQQRQSVELVRERTASEVRLAGGAASASPSREQQILRGKRRLQRRLQRLHLDSVEMADDGNCQFRALSHELYGTQKRYKEVRSMAVAHMQAGPEEFRAFFEKDEDWETYITGMAKNCTWGDELTLRAVADAAGVKIHLVTSDSDNWYLEYQPADGASIRELFLNYISPIHYNALKPGK